MKGLFMRMFFSKMLILMFVSSVSCHMSNLTRHSYSRLYSDDPESFEEYGVEESQVPISYYKRNHVVINMEIYLVEAECYAPHTESRFSMVVSSLTDDSMIQNSVKIQSHEFYYDDDEMSWHVMLNRPADKLLECLRRGGKDCFPRGDVVFIKFSDSSFDHWDIDRIEINVFMALGPRSGDRHKFEFLHELMFPCGMHSIDKPGIYQIGPHHGLFLKLDQDEFPEPGTWVRDWI